MREHTTLAPVPFVPEVRLYTASEITPLWQTTEAWLASQGVPVPFWSVPWAGGQALARWVFDHAEIVRGKRVLDFGTGSGLVAIAAMKAGASFVRAVDIDPLACAAARLNSEANGLEAELAAGRIVIASADVVGADIDETVVLAGDVWYEEEPAVRFATWLRSLTASGRRVVTGDPGRHYVPDDAREIARYDVPTVAELEGAASRTTRILTFA